MVYQLCVLPSTQATIDIFAGVEPFDGFMRDLWQSRNVLECNQWSGQGETPHYYALSPRHRLAELRPTVFLA